MNRRSVSLRAKASALTLLVTVILVCWVAIYVAVAAVLLVIGVLDLVGFIAEGGGIWRRLLLGVTGVVMLVAWWKWMRYGGKVTKEWVAEYGLIWQQARPGRVAA